MEIIPGIHLVNIPLPGFALHHINVYLVRGDTGWMLVDCGWNTPEAFNALQNALKELHIGFENISQVVITHIHPDHYGMSGRIKELSGCKVAMHQTEAKLIESRYIWMEKLLGDIGDFLTQNGVPPEEVTPLKNASLPVLKFIVNTLPDIVLKGGETIAVGKFNFQVLRTPGHSPGHICLYEPAHKALLAGDHILTTTTPNVSLHPQSRGNPLADFLQSLQTIDQLDVALVLPGHDNVFRNVHERVQELITHHNRRTEEVINLVGKKAQTAYDIAPRISWVTSVAAWQDLPAIDRRFAVLETLAHLEFLYHQGRMEKISKNGRILYQCVKNKT
jgi:glyoxylase-like metal-dependent hydrolase (beta-lactamase superfamily II)